LTWGDRGCFSSPPASEFDSLIVPRLVSLPNVIFDTERDVSTSIPGTRSSGVVAAGGVGGLIEGTGEVSVRVVSDPCGNETVNGLIRGTAECLFKSLCSTGDLVAIMLAGETGALSNEIGDEGAEDTRLITLSFGKTVIPHLLVGRTGAGVNSGGVVGETGSVGGDGRITASADSLWSGEEGGLSVQSPVGLGGVVRGVVPNEVVGASVVL
jgi:hypothetical protein